MATNIAHNTTILHMVLYTHTHTHTHKQRQPGKYSTRWKAAVVLLVSTAEECDSHV